MKQSSIDRHREDRRREERVPAEGDIRLFPDRFSEASVTGQLLDMSASGFRARHNCRTLSGGEVVRFVHASGAGSATVVWTRIVSDHVESGFLLVPEPRRS